MAIIPSTELGWEADVPLDVDHEVYRRGYLGPTRADLHPNIDEITLDDLFDAFEDADDDGAPALPAPEDTFDELVVHHIVERIPPDFLPDFWRALYAMCKHGAKVHVAGVYWHHQDVHADPTRYRGLSERLFAYLSPGGRHEIERDELEDDLGTATLRGIDFDVRQISYITEPEWEGRSDEAKTQAATRNNNVIRRLRVTLIAHKPAREKPEPGTEN